MPRRRGAFRHPFARPLVPPPDEWLGFLAPAYEHRWFANGGPVAERLERELAAYCGAADREAVLVSSATAGLTAALMGLEVRGKVALPAFTFPATAHAVCLAGCTPVLCDVDPVTWELTPDAAAAAIAEQGCRAVVHVRPFGLCRDVEALEAVTRAAGVPLILDSAAAFGGALADGTRVGGQGDAEVFSFHATKVFAVGEGGVVLAPPATAERLRHVINFSLAPGDVTGPGLNAKLSDLSAAVGLAMLRRLDEHIEVRACAVGRLERVAAEAGASMGPQDCGAPPWQGLPLLLRDARARAAALATLHRSGVEGRTYYAPGLHRTAAFRAFAPAALPVTDALAARMLCLPVYSDLVGSELDAIASVVDGALIGVGTERGRRPRPARAPSLV